MRASDCDLHIAQRVHLTLIGWCVKQAFGELFPVSWEWHKHKNLESITFQNSRVSNKKSLWLDGS